MMFFQFRHVYNEFLLYCHYFFAKSEAEKNIFKMRYKIRFLMNSITIENLNNAIYVFSNDINCDEGFLFIRYLYNKKTQRVFYQARSLTPSKI